MSFMIYACNRIGMVHDVKEEVGMVICIHER